MAFRHKEQHELGSDLNAARPAPAIADNDPPAMRGTAAAVTCKLRVSYLSIPTFCYSRTRKIMNAEMAAKEVERPRYDAVVVLGDADLENATRPRVEMAARLHRDNVSKVFIFVGTGPELDYMGPLAESLGIPKSALRGIGKDDPRAIHTVQKAKYAWILLNDEGSKKGLLITSKWDAEPALKIFEHYAPQLAVLRDWECLSTDDVLAPKRLAGERIRRTFAPVYLADTAEIIIDFIYRVLPSKLPGFKPNEVADRLWDRSPEIRQ